MRIYLSNFNELTILAQNLETSTHYPKSQFHNFLFAIT